MGDSASRRSRSRSPAPARRGPKSSRGFRWKDNRSKDTGGDRDDYDRRRDYRNRSPPRHSDRDGGRGRQRPPRDREYDRRERREDGKPGAKKGKKTAPPPPTTAGEEMIIVNVNDRLGTKSAIPCLPSDTVGQLKLMVAARIGREKGQIMLKRQGERPFKDHITLADYGISNGVQLDLEVDTGD